MLAVVVFTQCFCVLDPLLCMYNAAELLQTVFKVVWKKVCVWVCHLLICLSSSSAINYVNPPPNQCYPHINSAPSIPALISSAPNSPTSAPPAAPGYFISLSQAWKDCSGDPFLPLPRPVEEQRSCPIIHRRRVGRREQNCWALSAPSSSPVRMVLVPEENSGCFVQ